MKKLSTESTKDIKEKKELWPLPEGWVWSTLAETCEIVLGQSPASSTYNVDGEGLPFFQGKAEFGDLYPTVEKWCSSPKKIAEKNDILISVRAPVGPTNISKERSCIGRGLAALRPKDGIPNKFLLYYLRYIEKEWDSKATGTTFKAITGDVLRNQEIPLPPIREQERIVARLEELLTDLDAGVSALERVRAGVGRYKAAVLIAAYEGRLFGDNGIGDGESPEGWCWRRIGDNCFVTKLAGFEFTKYVKYIDDGEIPVIRAQNITKHGFQAGNYIYVKRGVFEHLSRSRLRGGEILMAFVGSVGNVGIAPFGEELFLGPNVALIRVDEKMILNKYLYYYLMSTSGKSSVLKFSKSTTQSSISMANIRDVVFPLPPLEEQRRIVAEVECRLESVRAVEAAVEIGLKRAARLRRAVLKAAFMGRI
jgi:type I restriction enzyme S subunit